MTTPQQTHQHDNSKDERQFLYLAGIGVSHSIAPPMHTSIAKQLNLPWTFHSKECPTVQDVMKTLREPTCAGMVVTMPYKQTIMQHLDGLDELALKLGACNNVYRAKDGTLRGTNTDWRGIKGCLLGSSDKGIGKTAMIVGAGGASRAAVYALFAELNCETIYIINRDEAEVAALLKDATAYDAFKSPKLIHVQSAAQAKKLPTPFYIVGTVPDFEPQTAQEIESRDIQVEFLSREGERGVLLDMCFKPRVTRMVKLAHKHGWPTVEGTEVIGHQIHEQWRLWTLNDAGVGRVDEQAAWSILRETAEKSPGINF